ncbi:cbb3-type cytochrome oxidase assembly protein CcoS [Falsihalocynthiibacter sp. S25ZX9]|uniref:cbb3-type cytochrome oxidase assembly protein CcoS n=1 Tax=Falsihalocynthiibacter sp. S25ZX9 TaxID=3240870 RepID=UPI00350F2BB2
MARLPRHLEGRAMSLLVLIPLSISFGLIGVAAFFWAFHNNQFDDPQGNASRVLLKDIPPQTKGQKHDNLAPHPDHKNS